MQSLCLKHFADLVSLFHQVEVVLSSLILSQGFVRFFISKDTIFAITFQANEHVICPDSTSSKLTIKMCRVLSDAFLPVALAEGGLDFPHQEILLLK